MNPELQEILNETAINELLEIRHIAQLEAELHTDMWIEKFLSQKPEVMQTEKVTVISIWSKHSPSTPPAIYTVDVPAGSTEGMLEAAFQLTNSDNRPLGRSVCSTSPGDILVVDSNHYLVEGVGFAQLTHDQSLAIQKLSSRDTSMGLEWLIRNGNVAA